VYGTGEVRVNDSETLDSRIRIAMLSLIPVAFLVPFLNKAYHIDDTLFVYAARQILKSPGTFTALR
jgi:hypothetical protein